MKFAGIKHFVKVKTIIGSSNHVFFNFLFIYGKWVFCKHKDRTTLEVPGGHREPGENIADTARRELYEETGAIDYSLTPICVYSVTGPNNFDGAETFGKLYFADIFTFETELHSEIENIVITDSLPENWTYPEIQPKLIDEAHRRKMI